jgi:anti-sigma regulatory factor (Ser/Thr protein kinase)
VNAPTCSHDLVLFSSDQELVDTVAPFVADGVAAGDRVLVHTDPDGFATLHAAVAGPGVEFAAAGYATPIATLAAYQQLCDIETPAGRLVRAVAPIPTPDDPGVRAEWMRYEALVGRALGPYRFAGLCLYDTRTTAPDLVDHARTTHRHLRGPDGPLLNSGARPDGDVLRDIDATYPWPAVPAAARAVATVDLPTTANAEALPGLRRTVRRALRDTGLPDESLEEFLLAVGEVLANALQHGRGPVRLRLLTEPGGWWCTVTDHGPGIPDPYTGVDSPLPGNPAPGGTGLWIARQFSDQLTLTRTPTGGTDVVLHRHR